MTAHWRVLFRELLYVNERQMTRNSSYSHHPIRRENNSNIIASHFTMPYAFALVAAAANQERQTRRQRCEHTPIPADNPASPPRPPTLIRCLLTEKEKRKPDKNDLRSPQIYEWQYDTRHNLFNSIYVGVSYFGPASNS